MHMSISATCPGLQALLIKLLRIKAWAESSCMGTFELQRFTAGATVVNMILLKPDVRFS